MKGKLINYLQRFSYPQSEFVASIIPFINKTEEKTLVDAPCGTGVTSWQFSKLKNITAHGYDIDKASITYANKSFKGNNLVFKAMDIHSAIDEQKDVNYFCIINSLFLLPEPDSILTKIKPVLATDGLLFIVIPNTEGPNFKWFQNKYPGVNKLILSKEQIEPYFSSKGWRLLVMNSIVYTRTYGRRDIRFLSVLSLIYLRIINYFQSAFKIGTPNYFTLVLKRAGE